MSGSFWGWVLKNYMYNECATCMWMWNFAVILLNVANCTFTAASAADTEKLQSDMDWNDMRVTTARACKVAISVHLNTF